jgi:phospholipid/cholesterol/gamma-HCH transport system substrate-binding protein
MRSRPGVRRAKRRLHPLVIAAVTIFVAAFITYDAFNHGLPFVHRFTIYALVRNSVNVRSGSPVRIAGIDVGEVEGVEPARASRLSRIAFSINSGGLPIHIDATVRIRDRLFLEGGYYLELDPGSPTAPVARDGYTIGPSRTSSPVQFYEVLSTFNAAARASLTRTFGSLDEGLGGLARLKTAVPQFEPLLKDTAQMTRALRGTEPGDVGRLLESGSQVAGTLAGSSSQLADLVTGLDRTSGALAATDRALGDSLAGLDETLRAAPASLRAIDASLPPVNTFAGALAPSLRHAAPLIDGVTGAVRELAAVVAPASRAGLLSSLNATFAEFPSLLTELATAFPITQQLSDCVTTHLMPVLTKTVPDGPLTTGDPVWQDFVHFLPGLAGATASFDGNGPYTRALLGAGTDSLTGGATGSAPILGQLVGTAPPGNSSLLGARPAWVGDLTPADFRPDARCTAQQVPSLASPAAAADLRSSRASSPGASIVARATRVLRGAR